MNWITRNSTAAPSLHHRLAASLSPLRWGVAATVLCSSPAIAALPVAPERLPATNLLVYRSTAGRLAPVKNKAQWRQRRREILAGMQQIMGPLPDQKRRCPLEVRVSAETDCGSYVCRSLTYASEPGSRVPADLLIPKAAFFSHRRLPAVLALHPTDMEYGRRVLLEELRPYYRAYGRDLAERGFVVLAPAYPMMADYQPDLKALGYQSGTMKAIWDNQRALDLLETLPFVDKKHFGALGHSLGGHNAIFTAVFDPRIKVVVSSCGFDSFADYMDGQIAGWTSERYMPRLKAYAGRLDQVPFDFHELIGALAPRRVFVNAPIGDSNFRWRSVDQIALSATPIFQLYRVPDNLRIVHPSCGHDFPPEIREAAYQFLRDGLR
ncbi:MAG TPA: alpha/beta hydrolase [Verrucomicrobiae bacterium]